MAELKKTDLAEDGFLNNVIPSQEELKAVLSLDAALKSIAKTAKEKIVKEDSKRRLADIKQEEAAQIALERIAQQKIKTDKERIRLEEQLRKQSERQAKAMKDEESAYKRVSKTLTDLRNQYKDLAVQGKANTAEARAMLKEINRLDSGLKQVDATVGQHQRNVGNYTGVLKGATGMMQQFGVALGGVAIARNALGVVKDFDQGVANLASVLGKSREQVVALEEDAKRLGAATSFTASQVAQLQTEYAKLGFTEKEILAATEATLNLAAATGTELGRAAEVAGSTVRAFGLTADETARVTDVMAKSFSTSALDMEKFAESMKYVAPVSKAAGISVEETTAMLGALANAGISGSQAGTALRQVISEMDKTGKSTSEALKDLAASGLTLADAEDEVGKNAKTALLVLADQTDKIAELNTAYENAEGSAKEMADTQLNTLGGALALLQSAWEGFILKMNDASGIGSGLTKVIKFLANNLETILKVVGTLGAGFLAWKTTMIATRVAMTAYASAAQLMAIATGKAAVTTKAADVAMDGFNKTTKANPIGLLISLLATAVTAFISFADSASSAEKAQKRLNDAVEMGAANGKRAAELLNNVQNERIKLLEIEARERIANGENEKKVNAELLEQKKAYFEAENQFIDESIKKAKRRAEQSIEQEKKITRDALRNQELLERAKVLITDQSSLRQSKVIGKYNELYAQMVNERTKAEIDQLNERKKANEDYFKENLIATRENEKEITEEMKTAAKKRAEELALLRRRLEDMQDAEIEDEFTRRQQQLKRALDRELAAIKGNSQVENDLRLALQRKFQKDSDELTEEWRKKKYSKYKEADVIGDLSDEGDERRAAKRREATEKEFEQQDQLFEKRHKERRLEALKNTELTAEEVAKIERESEIQLLEEKISLRKLYGKETIDLEIQLAQLRAKGDEKELKSEKDHAENLKAVADAVTDYYSKKLDERLAMIDKEMNAAQKQADFYRELAATGNIQAEQSLLEQQRIIEEAERERERVERQKQQIQLVSSGLSTYQQKVAAGDKNPLLSTITEITALTQFLSNLPAFFDGTEDTGRGGGVDGKGGFHAILHPNERVMPAKDNKKLTGLSNSELADVGYKYRTGQLIELGKVDSAGNSWDISALLKKQDELIQAIKEKPVIDYNIEGVTQNAFNLMKRVVEGNKTTITKTRFRS